MKWGLLYYDLLSLLKAQSETAFVLDLNWDDSEFYFTTSSRPQQQPSDLFVYIITVIDV